MSKKTSSVTQNWQKGRQRQQRAKLKRKLGRNESPGKPRRNDWHNLLDADDAPEVYADERIMPLGETERRKQIEQRVAKTASQPPTPQPAAGTLSGRVMEVGPGVCHVVAGGEKLLCALRGSLAQGNGGYTSVVAVGDEVRVSPTGARRGMIEQVLPRRSEVARLEVGTGHARQLLAANVDQLLAVGSWRNPQLWPELLDRYIITAALNQVEPLVCVNKADLASDRAELEEAIAPYRAAGYRLIVTSAHSGEGLETLRATLSGKTTVLAGLSGVGKSTLLSAIQPGFELRTGEVNEESHQGRHTTTAALMLPYDDGFVIDTPGIREFGLAGVARAELASFYPEVAALAGGCRFGDCLHGDEPDCAVRAALQAGDLSLTRYESYLKILDTLPA